MTVPSSSSNCSTATALGSSTSCWARYSSSSRIGTGPDLLRGDLDALRAQDLADLRGRLRALGEPAADLLLVEVDRRRLGLGVVLAQDLDVAAITGGALIRRDDAPHRILPAAHTREAKSNCHLVPRSLFGRYE